MATGTSDTAGAGRPHLASAIPDVVNIKIELPRQNWRYRVDLILQSMPHSLIPGHVPSGTAASVRMARIKWRQLRWKRPSTGLSRPKPTGRRDRLFLINDHIVLPSPHVQMVMHPYPCLQTGAAHRCPLAPIPDRYNPCRGQRLLTSTRDVSQGGRQGSDRCRPCGRLAVNAMGFWRPIRAVRPV